MARVKQLPAGKSKAARTAAAKRSLAKKTADKKKTATKSKSKVSNAAPSTPTAPESAQAPVSSPTGSALSAANWQSDQTRLQSLAEDQDTVDSLNQEEADADSSYTSAVTDATKVAGERTADLDRQRAEFEKGRADDYKSLDTNMAYRGAARSSAADRGVSQIGKVHSKIAGEFDTEKGKAASYITDIDAKAKLAQEGRKGYVAKRRLTLTNRAAAGGVYSAGAGEGDGGVDAPSIDTPAAPAAKAAKAAPTFKGKYPGPDKYKGDKKKIAAAKTAAAKRRIAKKGK